MSTPFTLPPGTIVIHCRKPTGARRANLRDLKGAITAFIRSQKINRPIVGFGLPR